MKLVKPRHIIITRFGYRAIGRAFAANLRYPVNRDLAWTRQQARPGDERPTSLCYKAPTMRVLRYLAFVITAVWLFSVLFAADYCLVNGCSGASGNNIDGFLPAFGLAPIGLPAFIWTVAIFIRWVWHKLLKAGEKS